MEKIIINIKIEIDEPHLGETSFDIENYYISLLENEGNGCKVIECSIKESR